MNERQFNRFTKVVKRAISEGYEIDEHEEIETVLIDAENYIFSHCQPDTMERCELHTDGNHQYYFYIDSDKNEYNSTGEIFDFAHYKEDKKVYFRFDDEKRIFIPVNWFDIPMEGEERGNFVFVYDTIIDCDGKVIALYDIFK